MWKTKRRADEGFAILNRIFFFYGQAVRRPGGLGGSDVADDGQAFGRPFGENFEFTSRIQSGWLQLLPRPNQRRSGRNLRYSDLAEDDSETTIQRSTVRVRFSMLESCVDDVRKVVWRLSRRQWYPVGSLPTPSPRRPVFPKGDISDISC